MTGNGNGKSPVLITGGAGFVGTNLAHRLLGNGHRVVIFDNLSRPGVKANLNWLMDLHRERVQFIEGDIRNFDEVERAVAGVAEVFHFAAQVAVTTSLVDPLHDFEINARGTLNLLEAIRRSASPPSLVFTSTNKVYGDLADVSITEDGSRYVPENPVLRAHGFGEARPLDFHSPYGCSKGAADQYVLDYAHTYRIPALVFRMSCIYGLHQFGNEDQGWVAHFLIRALAGQAITIYGDGKQVRDILFIEDLLDAFLLAQRRMPVLKGQAYNIGGGPANTISLLELLALIEKLQGDRPQISHAPWRAADQLYYVSDIRKFSEATGWMPRINAEEGVALLRHWLLENVDSEAIAQGRWAELGARRLEEARGEAADSSPRSKRLHQRKKLVAA